MTENTPNYQDIHRSFEDVLDNVTDLDNLFSILWEYLYNRFEIAWGCAYQHNPLREVWRISYKYNLGEDSNLPNEISESHQIIDKLSENLCVCSSEICAGDYENPLDAAELPKNFLPCLLVLFGTELRAPAFISIGEKVDKDPYSGEEILAIRKAVKAAYRVFERIEISNQLVAADKSVTVSEVAGGIAHEINNNITPIIGRAQLLQRLIDFVPDKETALKLQMNADIIYSQSCKIARIAQNLTRLSQPLQVEFNIIDLEKELNQAVEIMSETAGKIKHFKKDDPGSQFILKLDFTPNLPKIRGDSGQLEQVFINLIINAAHAIEEKGCGTLTVGTKSGDGGTVTAFVEDTGIGMSPETIEKMWKPFFTTKKKGKGTGLGMAIVKNVIKAHGAEIKVQSQVGAGTRFEMIFKAQT